MHDISHKILTPYQPSWKKNFDEEKDKLQEIFGNNVIIEHIGSTSITGVFSKPIIDIAVLIEKQSDGDKFIKSLEKLKYFYDKPCSSGERHFFRKGKPSEFHLSISYKDAGNFWNRQILFRNYLRNHPKLCDEYSALKKSLLKKDITGKEKYVEGKSDFIKKVLNLAEKSNS